MRRGCGRAEHRRQGSRADGKLLQPQGGRPCPRPPRGQGPCRTPTGPLPRRGQFMAVPDPRRWRGGAARGWGAGACSVGVLEDSSSPSKAEHLETTDSGAQKQPPKPPQRQTTESVRDAPPPPPGSGRTHPPSIARRGLRQEKGIDRPAQNNAFLVKRSETPNQTRKRQPNRPPPKCSGHF